MPRRRADALSATLAFWSHSSQTGRQVSFKRFSSRFLFSAEREVVDLGRARPRANVSNRLPTSVWTSRASARPERPRRTIPITTHKAFA